MGLMPLFFENPVAFFILVFLLLYSIIIHEIAHGWVALLFGDDTARCHGRLTFNITSHLEPVGMLMLFLVGFGWAKPVPVDYYRLRHNRIGFFCVSLAGCAANILIATIAIFFLRIGVDNYFQQMLLVIARINIILGAFNLIPIPPLDGSKVLMSFLPQHTQRKLALVEPYGFFILIFLLFTGLLNPAIDFMQSLIFWLIGLLIHWN